MNATRTLSQIGLRWAAAGLTAGLLAVSLVGATATATDAQSASDTGDAVHTITVNGTGRVNASPDVADISIGVIERAKEASAASRKAAESMDSVVQALLGMGIDEKDIQTTNLSLNPQYDWNTEPATVVGWEASNTVTVTVRDIESVGAVVDTTVTAGANQVNGISFRVEDPTDAQAMARTAAVDDARSKAEQLAAAAGVEIVGVISITESGGQQPQPIYMDRAEMAMAAADTMAPTPVLPGEVELAVSVLIQYEIS
jgi:uncharacterized protein YggE